MKLNKTLLILLLILLMQFCLRLPFLNEPLDGDEGVYATIGQGILIGEVPYQDIFDHKPPVIYYTNALIFRFFGQSVLAIRTFTAIFALFGTLGIFWLAVLFWGKRVGFLSALFYAVFSGGPLIDGTTSNTESFMIVFMIYALLFFVLALNNSLRNRMLGLFFVSGLFSGLAVMTKQVAAVNFIVLAMFLLPYRNLKALREWHKTIFMALGFIAVPLLFLFYFWWQGAVGDFINFALLFNFGYVQSGINLVLLFRTVYLALCENSVIWVLAIAACVYSLIHDRSRANLLVMLWGGASLVGIIAGGHYFGHYYLQVLPALCLLAGYAAFRVRFRKRLYNWLALASLILLSLIILMCQYEFFLVYSPDEISLQKYGNPIYVVSRQLGKQLEQKTLPQDKILVIGLPQIHFYSKRRNPNKYFSLVGGGKYDIFLFGQKVYEKSFSYRINDKLRQIVDQDLTDSLKNSRTKFVVFQSNDQIIGDKKFMTNLKRHYSFSRELSGQGIVVFKRKTK